MRYRKFGRTDFKISVLSLGVVELHQIAKSSFGEGDGDVTALVRHAIDSGVNYLDLGYGYADDGIPARVFGEIADALTDGYRERVRIAVNLPSSSISEIGDLDTFLQKQASWFNQDTFDYCILDGLDRNTWPKLQKLGITDWADRSLAEGKFTQIGFSFHDDAFYLRDIVEAYEHWSHLVLQFSFMDTSHHPGVGGMKFAVENELPVIVRNPLKGGGLIKGIPDAVSEELAQWACSRSLTEWCMRSVWDHPEVTSVIGDIDTIAQLDEVLSLTDSDASEPGNLMVMDKLKLNKIMDAYRAMRPVFCTACRCCKPCPNGVDFVRLFEIINDATMYGEWETARLLYKIEGHQIEDCNECGFCLKTCPKGFQIPQVLLGAKKLLGE
jgi:predicted aldo/keto reductase-like oxidoreductase